MLQGIYGNCCGQTGETNSSAGKMVFQEGAPRCARQSISPASCRTCGISSVRMQHMFYWNYPCCIWWGHTCKTTCSGPEVLMSASTKIIAWLFVKQDGCAGYNGTIYLMHITWLRSRDASVQWRPAQEWDMRNRLWWILRRDEACQCLRVARVPTSSLQKQNLPSRLEISKCVYVEYATGVIYAPRPPRSGCSWFEYRLICVHGGMAVNNGMWDVSCAEYNKFWQAGELWMWRVNDGVWYHGCGRR